ncbi:MAG: M20 family metallopeptidase [Anaerolineales bacterium]
MINFEREAHALRDSLIARRRDFHQHPELSFQEERTARIVAETLSALGLEVQTGVGQTGVIGILEGAGDGPTVLVRCDMDALPIEEANDFEFRSQNPGVMHACGHDAHTAIALGVAELLHARRDSLHGRVKFVFQPAEEIGEGAQAMIEDGALQAPVPDYAFGLHNWPWLPVGDVVVSPGPLMAGAGKFVARLIGAGGHAASPHTTTDPVIAAAQITTALQTLVSRNLDPLEAAVLSVTQINAGEVFNVIPNEATLTGTFRTFTPATRDKVIARFTQLVEKTASAFNCRVEINIAELMPPLSNDPNVINRLQQAYARTYPGITQHTQYRSMISEDMGWFMEHAPGAYLFVGSGNPAQGADYPLHHAQFTIDEDALVTGAMVLAGAVSEYVFHD